MRKMLKTKIDKEFKPSPQFKKLYCTYLTLVILVFILPWLIPIIIFAPAIPALFISVVFLIILIFTAYWIPKYYDTIFYKLTKNEIFWKRGKGQLFFQLTTCPLGSDMKVLSQS